MVSGDARIGDDVPVCREPEDGKKQDKDQNDKDHEAPLVPAPYATRAAAFSP